MTTYTLSTGITVTSKESTTGYLGATFSPAWTLDVNRPFIAACSQPKDPQVFAALNAQQRTALHLGAYADPREAAYVIGMYRADPIATIQQCQTNGNIDSFPEDLYSLPVTITVADAQAEIARVHANKGSVTKPARKSVTAKEASANPEYRVSMNASQAITAIKAAVKSAKTRAETARADADRTAMLLDFETMTSTDFAAKYQFTA
jgi:hypothetical protein